MCENTFPKKNYAEDYGDTTLHSFGMPFFHHLAIHIKSYRAKRWSLVYDWEELDVKDYRIPACQYCIPSNFCTVVKSSHTSFHYFRLPAKELHSPRETAYFSYSDITIPGGVLFLGIQTSFLFWVSASPYHDGSFMITFWKRTQQSDFCFGRSPYFFMFHVVLETFFPRHR